MGLRASFATVASSFLPFFLVACFTTLFFLLFVASFLTSFLPFHTSSISFVFAPRPFYVFLPSVLTFFLSSGLRIPSLIDLRYFCWACLWESLGVFEWP